MQLSPTPLSSKFVSTGKEEGRRRTVLAIKLKFRRKRKKKERKRGRRGEKFSTSLRASPFPCGNRGKRVKFEFPEMKTVTARRDALPASWIQRRLRFETFRRRSFLIRPTEQRRRDQVEVLSLNFKNWVSRTHDL